MGNIPYVDILILAMIAVFILNRLRNVLGKRTGNEEDIIRNLKSRKTKIKESRPDIEETQNSSVENQSILHENPEINKGLLKIKKIDESFELGDFIEGSKKAFEYILKAYSSNNLKSLKSLLDEKIFNEYSKYVNDRLKKKEQLKITIIGVKEPRILSVKVDKSDSCLIDIRYESEQIHVTTNDKGETIDGDNNQILNIVEKWSFSKKLNSKSPIWTLLKISETN